MEGLPSPLDAVADMRATAKWIVAAAAGVGVVLLGGGPLAALGKVHDVRHAVVSFLGLSVSLLGIGWVIWRISDVLIPPSTTLATLETRPLANLRAQMEAEPEAYFGPFGPTIADLQRHCRQYDTAAANLAIMLAREQDPDRQRVLTQGLADARANASMAHRRLRRLQELIHAWTVRADLRRARVHAFVGIIIAALGAIVFVTATTAPVPTPTMPRPAPTITVSQR
jgi:hypothetical protein